MAYLLDNSATALASPICSEEGFIADYHKNCCVKTSNLHVVRCKKRDFAETKVGSN